MGVVLYELLYGKFPFNGTTEQQLYQNIIKNLSNKEIMLPSTKNISHKMQKLLKSMLTFYEDGRVSWESLFEQILKQSEIKEI